MSALERSDRRMVKSAGNPRTTALESPGPRGPSRLTTAGMAGVAKDADLSRQGLYKSLSTQGDPKLSTLLGILKALGMQVVIQPVGH